MTSRPNVQSDDPIYVLYVGDDPDLAELWRLRLELDGYRVRTVSAEGADWSPPSTVTPDLLFVDAQTIDRPGLSSLAKRP